MRGLFIWSMRKEIRHMAATLDDLLTAVTNLNSAVAAAVALLNAQSGSAAKVQSATDAVNADAQSLASAVAAATPAPPTGG